MTDMSVLKDIQTQNKKFGWKILRYHIPSFINVVPTDLKHWVSVLTSLTALSSPQIRNLIHSKFALVVSHAADTIARLEKGGVLRISSLLPSLSSVCLYRVGE
nr:uncharacterized protein LOC113692200 [Coffea arabica]XP_027070437.1 uncharacterized protein LOC113695512 [Coffea arabica]